ncbi:frizzled-4 [Condylostylus longicornis]|uniref:frizzled-4 n=1 Tax=Condylostylus longicornis TaxID=2530218 RepID=UPI00244DB10D|nr:frizzled-4 [Condylostylus longicornis]
MPNMLGHEVQADVDFTLQTFAPLIQYGCSTQLNFFLCSAYVPMCTPKVSVPIGPCRSLCETVRTLCVPVLQSFGFPWPPALDCNRFPAENNHEHMCMEGYGEPNSGPNGNINNNNNNGISTNVGSTGTIMNGVNVITPISKITSIHQTSCSGLAKSHLYIRLNRSGRCAPLCEADILFDQREKHLAEIWVTAWSYATLGTSIIAILCLIFTDTKWDKILTPLVACHTLVAIGWTVRFVVGRIASSCGYDPQIPTVQLLLIDGLSNASCAATFLLRYYFGMSAGIWWSILCLKWHRGIRSSRLDSNEPVVNATNTNNNVNNKINNGTITNKKNIRNKETFSNLAQLAAWGLPALQTGAVLVTRLVDADELLGTCYVGNQSDKALRLLVATPLFCYWIFGSVNLFAGYLVYRRNKTLTGPITSSTNTNHSNILPLSSSSVPSSSSPSSLSSSSCMAIDMNGVGQFLFIYCIPSALLLISVIYEFANSDIWLNLPEPSNEPTLPIKASMWSFMTRAFMELLLGVISSAWVLGPRISTLYKTRFGPKYKQTPTSKYPSSTAYSTASYQTVCQSATIMTSDKIPIRYPSTRKYPQMALPHPPARNKTRSNGNYKFSQNLSHYGNETVL